MFHEKRHHHHGGCHCRVGAHRGRQARQQRFASAGEWLAEKMRQEDAYAQAMREALGFETWALQRPLSARDQLFLR